MIPQKMPIQPQITPQILNLIAGIDEFRGHWRALRTLSPETLDRLRHVATIESAGSSTRIEGARLSDREVALLLAGVRTENFRSRDEEEVAGYAAAMEMIYGSWDSIAVSENHIRQLHRVLLQYSGKDERHRGEYKKNPNNVAAFAPDGRQIGIVFETASPFETPFEMERLVEWFARAQLEEPPLHPLLAIGIFVVWFLAIHPFEDGNGRLSRILTTLLLLRNGYAYVPFASLESIIEENKAAYYAALRETQQSMRTAALVADGSVQPDWEPWLEFFLGCLHRQKQKLEKRLAAEQTALPALTHLAVEVINLLGKGASTITVARAAASTGASRNTIKATLQTLVRRGLLLQHGKGRGVYYTLAA